MYTCVCCKCKKNKSKRNIQRDIYIIDDKIEKNIEENFFFSNFNEYANQLICINYATLLVEYFANFDNNFVFLS